jgi:hypothetical protein
MPMFHVDGFIVADETIESASVPTSISTADDSPGPEINNGSATTSLRERLGAGPGFGRLRLRAPALLRTIHGICPG